MVQHLKTQLDERDLTIQELQRGLQATQPPARITELQEMKEHVRITTYSKPFMRFFFFDTVARLVKELLVITVIVVLISVRISNLIWNINHWCNQKYNS